MFLKQASHGFALQVFFFSSDKSYCCQFLLAFLAEDGQDKSNDDAPENNPQYTTVYVGNLAPEAKIYYLFLTFSDCLLCQYIHIGVIVA